jgi:Stabilization of polarity axis
VVANDPKECSHAVLTFLSLIHPLVTTADVRPYLTVMDEDTEVYTKMVKVGKTPNVVLGIANPLLLKNLQNFTNVLHLDNMSF